MKHLKIVNSAFSAVAIVGFGALTTSALADTVLTPNHIIHNSLCVGFDCADPEAFGDDTIRMKENNLRFHVDDTSAAASFPDNDWQLTFNDSANGGLNKFSVDDLTGAKTPFTIEAGARTNSLYVESSGEVGIGTNNPVGDIHVKIGDTPTFRLEQDASSGFGAQVWDMAGNEANFFIRDVTNGSSLPFRIKPGAPTNSLSITDNGKIGLGVQSAGSELEIKKAGRIELRLNNTVDENWRITARGSGLEYGVVETTDGTVSVGKKMTLSPNGDLEVTGSYAVNGTTLAVPDYVFDSSYKLMSLSDLETFIIANKHLPNIKSAKEINTSGKLDMTQMQLKLLEKIEELTLYTLKQESKIDVLETKNNNQLAKIEQQEKQIIQNSKMKERLAILERLVTNLASGKGLLPSSGNKVAFTKKY